MGWVETMTLFDALATLANKAGGVTGARMTFIAISDNAEEVAFLTEMPLAELVPLIERWCAERRASPEWNKGVN